MRQTSDSTGRDAEIHATRASAGVILDKRHWLFIKNRYRMSLREIQVAILVCRGFSNDKMAQALDVKLSTVKTHLRSIYRKTRISNRMSLLLQFLDDIESSQLAPKPGMKPVDIVDIKPHSPHPSRKITKLRQ